MTTFREKLQSLFANHEKLIQKPNSIHPMWSNGVFERYRNPVVTANHVPVEWRYDLDEKSNPGLLERLGMNAALNPGAILFTGKPTLVVRFEGADRKSFFAVAQSDSPTEGFRCWDEPVDLPEAGDPDINVYDMRLTAHEDGWIYGLFCTERRDPSAPDWDLSAAVANCGVVRTKDLRRWERLPDLQSNAAQQRNVVLHPEFVDGKYALYTRPADLFMEAGKGRGIGWALCPDITHPVIGEEIVIDPRAYHTVKEAKNGQGPPPLKTSSGWLHLAHGVRNTAAGMRYVLYLFLTDLAEPWRVIARPGGHFMAPIGRERVGDVSNVLFCNGWIPFPDGRVAIYYASSDTRIHVAMSSIDCLLDYVQNTPEDGLKTRASLETRLSLLRRNRDLQRSADFQKDL